MLLNDARLAALAAIAMFVFLEDSAASGFGSVQFLYDTAATKISPFIGVVLIALAATILAARRPAVGLRSPRPFVVPLTLIVFALAFGIANGVIGYHAKKFTVLGAVATLAPLLLFPIIIVNVVRDRPTLRLAIAIGGAMAVAKSTLGILAMLERPDAAGRGHRPGDVPQPGRQRAGARVPARRARRAPARPAAAALGDVGLADRARRRCCSATGASSGSPRACACC